MNTTRTAYETPLLSIQQLRDLPSALAQSGCSITPSKNKPSCSASNSGAARTRGLHR